MDKKPESRQEWVLRHVRALLAGRWIPAPEGSWSHAIQGFLHFWVLVWKSFERNRCLTRATALAYTTLLALAPLLAVSVGVSTTLLKNDREQTRVMVEKLIDEIVPQLKELPAEPAPSESDQPEGSPESASPREVIEESDPDAAAAAEPVGNAEAQVVGTILRFIDNIHSKSLTSTSSVVLILVAIGLLSTIETSFNDIWGVHRGRSLLARITQYWAAITLGPIIVLLAMGLSLSSRFEQAQAFIRATPLFGNLIFSALPFVILVLLFALFYQLMPNTRVPWKAALVGGLTAAILWLLNSRFSYLFAARVVSASNIYGSFGVIPVFLLGLYTSWLIVLFGAQMSHAFVHRHAYVQEKQNQEVNQSGREFIALRLMHLVTARFQRGDPGPTKEQLSKELAVSSGLINPLVETLKESRLLLENSELDTTYSPGRPLSQITCANVLHSIREQRGYIPETRRGPERQAVYGIFAKLRKEEQAIAERISFEEILSQNNHAEGQTQT